MYMLMKLKAMALYNKNIAHQGTYLYIANYYKGDFENYEKISCFCW